MPLINSEPGVSPVQVGGLDGLEAVAAFLLSSMNWSVSERLEVMEQHTTQDTGNYTSTEEEDRKNTEQDASMVIPVLQVTDVEQVCGWTQQHEHCKQHATAAEFEGVVIHA